MMDTREVGHVRTLSQSLSDATALLDAERMSREFMQRFCRELGKRQTAKEPQP